MGCRWLIETSSQLNMVVSRFFLIALLAAWGGSPFTLRAQEPDAAKVAELREVIAEWVETERLVTEEKTGWEEKKASMAQLLDLYREELTLLDQELAEAGKSASAFDADQQKMERETSALRAARETMVSALREARSGLLSLTTRFPPPLSAEVAEEVATLEGWDPSEELRPALQALLTILDRANSFARTVTRSREVHDDREVEVIYCGLSHGYYVSAGSEAGLVVLGPTGWQWAARPELHGEIAEVLRQLDEQSPPDLVPLPVPAPRQIAKP